MKRRNRPSYQMGGIGSLYGDAQVSPSKPMPMYGGSPLEAVSKAAERAEKNYYEGIAYADKVGMITEAIKARAVDRPELDEHLAPIRKELEVIAASGDYENAMPRIANIARKLYSDPTINKIQENYAKEEALKKRHQGLQDKKETILFGKDYSNTPTVSRDPETGEILGYNDIIDTGQVKLPWDEKAEKIWNSTKADQYITDPKYGAQVSKALAGWVQTGTWKGISGGKEGDKINRQLGNALMRYKQSGEYLQQLEYYTSQNHPNPEKAVRDHLLSVGMMKVFDDNTVRYIQDVMMGEGQQGQGSIGSIGSMETTTDLPFDSRAYEQVMSSRVDNGYDPEKFEFKSRRGTGILKDEEGNPVIHPKGGVVKGAYYEGIDKDALESAEGVAYMQDVQAMAAIRGTEVPDFASEEAAEYAKAYRDLLEMQMHSYKVKNFDRKRELAENTITKNDVTISQIQDRVGKAIRSQYQGLKFYDMDTGKIYGGGDPEFEEFAANLSDLNMMGSLVPTHPYTQIPGLEDFADPRKATIPNKDGDIHNFLISRSEGSRNSSLGRAAQKLNDTHNTLFYRPGVDYEFFIGGKPVLASYIPRTQPDGNGGITIKGGLVVVTGGEPTGDAEDRILGNGEGVVKPDGTTYFNSIEAFNQYIDD